jgi:putative transposase
MMNVIQKTFSYRLKVTESEREQLAQYAGCARFVFNWGLAKIKKAFEAKAKIPSYADTTRQLTILKKAPETVWLADIHSQVLQQTLKDLEKGVKFFFTQRAKKRNVGFPCFKKKGIKDSFRYPQGIKGENGRVYLPKIGWLRYYDSRPIGGVIKQATIKRKGDHWYIHIVCEIPHVIAPVAINPDTTIGIDLGLTYFATLSNGQKIENPTYLKKELAKLRFAQRQLSRKKKGSSNRRKAAAHVAKLHERVSNKRKDFLHKVSTELVKNHDTLAVEHLSIAGMIRNRRLARAIADVGWAQFVDFLKYKATWFGKRVVQVGRFLPTSKQCSSCDQLQEMPLCVRRYACKSCGLDLDRDLNASINIRAAGLAVLACGGNSVWLSR